jgi:hypothetical protein
MIILETFNPYPTNIIPRYQREQAVNNAITSLKAANKATREAKEKEITEEYRNAENEAWNDYLLSSQTAYIAYATTYKSAENNYQSAKKNADDEYISTVTVGWNTYNNKVDNLDALFEAAVEQAGNSGFNPATFFNNGANGNQGNVLLVGNKKNNNEEKYPIAWKDFPSYGETGFGSTLGQYLSGNREPVNSGGIRFNNWIKSVNDLDKAKKFLNSFLEDSNWKKWVDAAASQEGIPEGALWAYLLTEMVFFNWNDYYEYGDSKGPAQLTQALVDYYKLEKAKLDNAGFIEGHIYMAARFMKNSLSELAIGRMYLENGILGTRELPQMSDSFTPWQFSGAITNTQEAFSTDICFCGRCENSKKFSSAIERFHAFLSITIPGNSSQENRNLSDGALIGIIVTLSGKNAAATNNLSEKQWYGYPMDALIRPQASWIFSRFRDGFFSLDKDGKLVITYPHK